MRKIIICIFLVSIFIYSCSEKNAGAPYWIERAEASASTDSRKAIEYLNKAIQLQPNYAETYFIQGRIYYENLHQHQLAIEGFNEAIRLNPKYAQAYQSRGVVYYSLQQYQRAIEDFNKAINLKPDNADTYKCRGYVYFQQGNKKLGCLDAKKSCDLGNCQLLEVAKGKGQCG